MYQVTLNGEMHSIHGSKYEAVQAATALFTSRKAAGKFVSVVRTVTR